MGWMADIGGSGGPGGEPADGHDPAFRGQLLDERPGGLDLRPRRAPVRRGGAWVGGYEVPAEGVELQLREHTLHDRGACLARPAPRQLPLGGEGDAGDAGAAVARGLTHEQERRTRPGFEVVAKTGAAKIRAGPVPVEVERRPDSSRSEPPHEPFRLHDVTMLMRVRGRVAAIVAVCAGVCAPTAFA